jgi:cellulose synthase/poly-beta-1,6-N-acetylglucosamine synthase-like glycosyltransferase
MLPPFSPNILMYILGLIDYLRELFHRAKENTKNYTVSAIIPTKNEADTLAGTIESLLKQSVRLNQIIVIDDASTDESNQIAKSYKNILVLKNDNSLGKALSINRILNYVNSDLVAIIDGDTELENTFIQRVMKKFDSENVAAVSGFVVPSKQSENAAIRRARVIEDYYSQSTLKRGQDLISGLFVVSGCCALYRTKILKRYNIPEDTLTEDLDLTWQLQRTGYKVSFTNAYAYTTEPKTISEYRSQIKRWYAGFFQSLKKHGLNLLDSVPLTFTLSLIIIECLFFTLFWLAIIGLATLSLILGGEFAIFRTILYIFLGVDLFTVCFPAILRAYRTNYLTEFLLGIPPYYLIRLLNAMVWWGTLTEWLFEWNPGWGDPRSKSTISETN